MSRPRRRHTAALRVSLLLVILVCYFVVEASKPGETTRRAKESYSKALKHLSNKSYDEALEALDVCTRLSPAWQLPHSVKGGVLAQVGRLSEALTALVKAHELDSTHLETILSIATLYTSLSQPHEATIFIDKALAVDPLNDRAKHLKGQALYDLADRGPALEVLRTVSLDTHLYSETKLLVAKILFEEGRVDESRAELEELVKREPSLALARYRLGLVAASQGQVVTACSHFSDAILIDPAFANNMGPDFYFVKGELARGYGNVKEAEEWYKKTLEQNSAHVGAAFSLSLIRSERCDWGNAVNEEAILLNIEKEMESTYSGEITMRSVYAEYGVRLGFSADRQVRLYRATARSAFHFNVLASSRTRGDPKKIGEREEEGHAGGKNSAHGGDDNRDDSHGERDDEALTRGHDGGYFPAPRTAAYLTKARDQVKSRARTKEGLRSPEAPVRVGFLTFDVGFDDFLFSDRKASVASFIEYLSGGSDDTDSDADDDDEDNDVVVLADDDNDDDVVVDDDDDRGDDEKDGHRPCCRGCRGDSGGGGSGVGGGNGGEGRGLDTHESGRTSDGGKCGGSSCGVGGSGMMGSSDDSVGGEGGACEAGTRRRRSRRGRGEGKRSSGQSKAQARPRRLEAVVYHTRSTAPPLPLNIERGESGERGREGLDPQDDSSEPFPWGTHQRQEVQSAKGGGRGGAPLGRQRRPNPVGIVDTAGAGHGGGPVDASATGAHTQKGKAHHHDRGGSPLRSSSSPSSSSFPPSSSSTGSDAFFASLDKSQVDQPTMLSGSPSSPSSRGRVSLDGEPYPSSSTSPPGQLSESAPRAGRRSPPPLGPFDVTKKSDTEVAELIFSHGVDILIDTRGHSAGHRLGVLSLRPAPIQLSYGGPLDSLWNSNIAYLVVDERVLLPEIAGWNLEAHLILPHSVFVYDHAVHFAHLAQGPTPPPFLSTSNSNNGNDNNNNNNSNNHNRDQSKSATAAPTGAASGRHFYHPYEAPPAVTAGIAAGKLVYLSPHSAWRLDRETFVKWIAILRGAPRVLLWIWHSSSASGGEGAGSHGGGPEALWSTLAPYARLQGVDPTRIIVSAKPGSRESGMNAMRQYVSLVLDCPRATGGLALVDGAWVGVPFLTVLQPHGTMERNLGVSLAYALGLPPFLVAPSMDAYVEVAIELASEAAGGVHPSSSPTPTAVSQSLREAREALKHSRNSPLFDVLNHAKALEAGLLEAWQAFESGRGAVEVRVKKDSYPRGF